MCSLYNRFVEKRLLPPVFMYEKCELIHFLKYILANQVTHHCQSKLQHNMNTFTFSLILNTVCESRYTTFVYVDNDNPTIFPEDHDISCDFEIYTRIQNHLVTIGG